MGVIRQELQAVSRAVGGGLCALGSGGWALISPRFLAVLSAGHCKRGTFTVAFTVAAGMQMLFSVTTRSTGPAINWSGKHYACVAQHIFQKCQTTLVLDPGAGATRCDDAAARVAVRYESVTADMASGVSAIDAMAVAATVQEQPPIWSNMVSGAFLSHLKRLETPLERQTSDVWALFDTQRFPGRAKDFMRHALWSKLSVGMRTQHVYHWLNCILCAVPETTRHAVAFCKFIGFAADAVR